jgi:GGDEF domain-containing protein
MTQIIPVDMGTDPYESIVTTVRQALPGEAADRLLGQIADALSSVADDDAAMAYARLRLELEREIATDPVTGLPNRARFNDDLARALAAAQRYGEPLALLVLELVDQDADERAAGEALLRLTRVSDVVARIAPRRFAIILPRTGTVGCALAAARLSNPDGPAFAFGSAALAADVPDAATLLARAEETLGRPPTA